ncbi:hypothetical protein PRECH8_14220 [Insulibacter thermoxylanivorax]|uniref:Cupin type-2 domain-containing protein n=1 Tax=Insulibacter thermoxylanivorax TaxID=2749268 RepID=A0A916QCB7_9BACL|nr:cupin domain-containing protein [Insulibacter thermoxylanivorax]GFR38126.1 hypothetical protein PRECH8_14220 [Insulibacter thermoxylanivorax]
MELKQLAHYREYSEERLTKRVIYKHEHHAVFVLNFMPGQELPSHQHPGSSLFVLVLEGEGDVVVDGEVTKVKKDDCLLVEGEEFFSFRNTGSEPVSLYVVLTKIPSEQYAQDV